ncbi:peroxisomal multifunctional beta-oxidation protein (MFP) [Exophiala aquamarina CBS 119918]|uniref:Peroxisomal hydratase-dehydrogenase-epimerase n=1 Tax=Exophiala aquamarina CBS 119918 TaxID=1182545 RepID=A0A072NV14_9EURO|nr:peroxisomal multifunctional beta-oxidation protein (MFP) [Exophiala aquamarina CBS 119918]KEF51217.1 peroxisomal multifunctional beta-oxidation protein (MFP) [Exophiala aquamarina CBS 119918]
MAQQICFDGLAVVVTGASRGIGRAYALFFASRGGMVVVNDFGGSLKGEGTSAKAADMVVEEIRAAGGTAVANYDSVENGERIIETAINAFGRVDVLINNAGILRDVSFENMKDSDWDHVISVHLNGVFKCSRAAWVHFRRQNYGRIINTTSAAGLFGSFGQTNYSAAKLAQVGLTKSLAKEGVKYNILCNAIAPVAASRMTETIMNPDLLENLRPDWVVPLVAVLASAKSKESGSVFEVGAGRVAKFRWERSQGLLLKTDETYTAGAILKRWPEVMNFTSADHPTGLADMVAKVKQAQDLPKSQSNKEIRLDGKVALVTGGGTGLGRIYSLALAKLGASVVVNDMANAENVTNEIKASGGKATANSSSVEDGASVVKTAIDIYNRIDILINNAGIVRDRSFANMSDQEWHAVIDVHLRGTYSVTKAAYPYMLKQRFGRIVNTTSPSGIYGNFGQANYSSAKAGILGFSQALALEGMKNNILVNTIAPNAGTQMSKGVLPKELYDAFKPEYIVPLVTLLSSDASVNPPITGMLFEVGSGWQARTRWQRSGGHNFPLDTKLTPEQVVEKWSEIIAFDGRADNPESGADAVAKFIAHAGSKPSASLSKTDYLSLIEAAKKAKPIPTEFTYTDRDVILYNLSLNANASQLSLVYENDKNFQPLPTFGVIPFFSAVTPFKLEDLVPPYSPSMSLHGGQYLEIRRFPIPTSVKTVSYRKLVEVVDKVKSTVIALATVTQDAKTGEDLFYNESTLFIRGVGNFGGQKKVSLRGNATTDFMPPRRAPDVVVEEKTSRDQAALYRLNGDRNPLHIDPEFSSAGGWKDPILHGLCSFGISGKHIKQKFGLFKNIKVRFAGAVVPGQTLLTEMWKEGNIIVFQTRVKETRKLAIADAGAELVGAQRPNL